MRILAIKELRSGCEHSPKATSMDFCWQCRIEELNKLNANQMITIRSYMTTVEELKKEIRELRASFKPIYVADYVAQCAFCGHFFTEE
jgi:hypothetical protein